VCWQTPTLSGLHDLERVSDLAKHSGVEVQVWINKWALNEEPASAYLDGTPPAGENVCDHQSSFQIKL